MESLSDPPGAVEEFVIAMASAVASLCLGDTERARQQLIPMAGAPTATNGRRGVPLATQARAFFRDGFTCRYCGRRTILPPLMRLVSEFLPDILPYHPHGKQSECHIAFWIYMASCDRVVPLARGGTSGLSNPVTSCYQCNSIKQSWLLSELRWEIRPAGSQWDGLSSSYEMLLDRLPGEKIAYYRDWRCALAAARRLVKNSSE